MIVAGIEPKAEMVHWWFATGILVLGLLFFAEPQVFVVLVGVLFRWLLAPGIVEDLEASE